MNTKNFFAILALFLMGSFAYGQMSYTLTSRVMEGYDKNDYRYDDAGRLDSMHTALFESGEKWEFYRLFTYGEDGMQESESIHQYMDDGTIKLVSRVDYEWTEDGKIHTRKNYNSWDGELSHSATLEWVYNEEGLLVEVRQCFAGDEEPFQIDSYTYDDKGVLLKEETWSCFWGDKQLIESLEYSYDEQGRVTKAVSTYYDSFSGEQSSSSYKTYTFDENGDLTEFASFSSLTSVSPIVKYIYHYNQEAIRENAKLPFNFEDREATEVIAMSASKHIIERVEWWQEPNGSDNLEYIGDYIYNYETSGTGIDRCEQVALADVSFFVDNGVLYLHGLKPGSPVQIYDMNGALVSYTTYETGGISLGALPKGIYVTRTSGKVFRFVR